MKAINPAELDHKQVYKLMTGSIVPRAIAWVSTVDENGIPNLAPFSFFTAITSNPPSILFCPGTRSTDGSRKDTYHNICATGEFVINFVNEANAAAMNLTAVEVPPQVNEFERASVTPVPAQIVRVPRVQESPIHFECKLSQTVEVGDAHIVIGEIVYMHFDEAVFREGNYIDPAAYQPVGRLAGNQYAYVHELFELKRPPSEIKG